MSPCPRLGDKIAKILFSNIDERKHLTTGWPKSRFSVQKIEYLHFGSQEWAEFFTADRRVVIVHFLQDKTGKSCLKIQVFTSTKKFYLLTCGKNYERTIKIKLPRQYINVCLYFFYSIANVYYNSFLMIQIGILTFKNQHVCLLFS